MRKNEKGGGIISIEAMRAKLGLTQKELAQKLGVDQSAVSQWETNKCGPSRKKLPAIANVLGCTVDDLLRAETGDSKESE